MLLAFGVHERVGLHHEQPQGWRALYRRDRRPLSADRSASGGEGLGLLPPVRLKRLVYAEEHDSIEDAIPREKAMKAWKRAWKIELVEGVNPAWDDLFGVVL